MRVLVLGDVVARFGRQILKDRLPGLRKDFSIDLVLANGENSAGGIGITNDALKEIYAAGVDVVTSGNHIWRHQEIYSTLGSEPRLLRPANMPPGTPGSGLCVYSLADGRKVAVINLIGRTFMDAVDCPFAAADALLGSLPEDVRLRFIDFHAEATSEKKAMGFYVDGRATLMAGSHTHVQTADAMILPGGTGYLSDLGMCGVERESILGMEAQAAMKRFITCMPARFSPQKGQASISGLLLDADDCSGKTLSLSLVRHNAPAVISL